MNSSHDPQEGPLKLSDVCRLLNVHPSTVYRMVREARLRAYRLGTQLRFRREDVNALLERV